MLLRSSHMKGPKSFAQENMYMQLNYLDVWTYETGRIQHLEVAPMAVTASAMDAWQHGTSLAEEGRFSDAMMAFDKALKLGMQTPEVYEAVAQCRLEPESTMVW